MSDLVPADEIERIVGIARHRTAHYGRAVSAEQTVYILHSQECKDSGINLRDCPFSLALDWGISEAEWWNFQDRPVALTLWHGELRPAPEGGDHG